MAGNPNPWITAGIALMVVLLGGGIFTSMAALKKVSLDKEQSPALLSKTITEAAGVAVTSLTAALNQAEISIRELQEELVRERQINDEAESKSREKDRLILQLQHDLRIAQEEVTHLKTLLAHMS